ncbi:MAG: hypothetical protein K8W52_46875 [Deltaproteobacteria bacterium]|nr:hypothetical protein [Deltaproteobacteria bacterium]
MRVLLSLALVASLGACAHTVRDPVRALEQTRDFRPLIRGGVTNGGVYFTDAACARTFATPGAIAPAQQPEFARCLATLHFTRSARTDALGDVVVMDYAPGFEIEARVVPDPDGPRLTWIGPSSQRADGDVLPTISGDALERLRVAGTVDGPVDDAAIPALEADVAAGYDSAHAWVKLCLDGNGAVQSAHVHEVTSPRAMRAFLAAAQRWAFRPFVVDGHAVPVCAMARLDYPAVRHPVAEVIPLPPPPSRGADDPLVLPASERSPLRPLARNSRLQPDPHTQARILYDQASTVQGSFRVCVDAAGHVESVLPLRTTGYAAFDNELMSAMHAWTYEPYLVDDKPTPVCAPITFIYSPTPAPRHAGR